MKCRLKENPVYECIRISGDIQSSSYKPGKPHEIYEWFIKNVAAGTKRTDHWGDNRLYARPEMNFKYCDIIFWYHDVLGPDADNLDAVSVNLYRKGSEKPSKKITLKQGDVLMVVPTNGKGKKHMTVVGVPKEEWLKKYEVVEDKT